MATYTQTPLHILSPATIYAGTLGTYCLPKAYIIYADINTFFHAIMATILALNFDTSCRRRQNMPSTLKQIVDSNSTDLEIKYLGTVSVKSQNITSIKIVKFKINRYWTVNLNQIW